MIPYTLVLEPGLRVYKLYNGYGSSAGLLWRSYVSTCAPYRSVAGPIGTSAARSSAQLGRKVIKRVSIRTEKRRRSCWLHKTNRLQEESWPPTLSNLAIPSCGGKS